jgi:hypothetical protein
MQELGRWGLVPTIDVLHTPAVHHTVHLDGFAVRSPESKRREAPEAAKGIGRREAARPNRTLGGEAT